MAHAVRPTLASSGPRPCSSQSARTRIAVPETQWYGSGIEANFGGTELIESIINVTLDTPADDGVLRRLEIRGIMADPRKNSGRL